MNQVTQSLLNTLRRIAAGDPTNRNFAALAIAEARDAIELAEMLEAAGGSIASDERATRNAYDR